MADCIFCKIIRREIDSKLEFEDADCMVFHDVRPRSRVHLLIVPKKHIASLRELVPEDEGLMGKLLLTANQMAKKQGLEDYNVAINVGRKAGQEVFHLHLHLKSAD